MSTRVLSWTQHNILGWLAELGSGLSYTYALGKSHKERSQSCESDWKTIIEVLARNMPFIFACPLAIMFPSSFIPATARPPEANRHLLQSRTAKLGMGLPRTRMAEQKAIKKNTPEPPHDQRALRVAEDQHAHQSKAKFRPGAPIPLRVILLVLSVLVVSVFVWERWNRKTRGESSPQTVVAAAPVYTPGKTLRAMVGSPAPYVDHGGFTWDGDHFCSGGSSFSISGHTVQGTEDSLLFSGGRRGIFHCSYPVSPGTYEVHLLFAETSGLQEASRNVTFSVNGGPPSSLDVVDDAGGDDIATTKVFTDVAPASDGSIHLDFTTSEALALLNLGLSESSRWFYLLCRGE